MSGLTLADFWDVFGPSVVASCVAAALCGFLGFFVVVRRVAFVSGALGQVSGLGVALGFLVGSYFGVDPHYPTPLYLDPVVIALLISGAVAAMLGYVPRVRRTTPESAVAFAYLAAAALAIFALASPRILQEAHEVDDLLYGKVVTVRQEHLAELVVVAGLVLLSQLWLFKDFLFVSFDAEMARTLGVPVTALEVGLNLTLGISVAVATRAVGALPVFGFLVLPASAGLIAFDRVGAVLASSTLASVGAATLGFYLSYRNDHWPTGPTMVILCAALWPLAALWRVVRPVMARWATPR